MNYSGFSHHGRWGEICIFRKKWLYSQTIYNINISIAYILYDNETNHQHTPDCSYHLLRVSAFPHDGPRWKYHGLKLLGRTYNRKFQFTENYIRTSPIHRLLRWRGCQLQQAPLLGCGHRSHNRYRHCVFQQARFIFRDLGPEPRPGTHRRPSRTHGGLQGEGTEHRLLCKQHADVDVAGVVHHFAFPIQVQPNA